MSRISPSNEGIAFTPANPVSRQRAKGIASFSVVETNGSRLDRLFQEGAAKVRFLKMHSRAVEAVLINTAGGLVGGDCFHWAIEVGQNAHCVAITQAFEKAYRSDGETAEIALDLSVAAGGRLDWIPQETILFEGARVRRRFEINLARKSRFLAVEAVILGRRAMGEIPTAVNLKDAWRVYREGHLIFADEFRLDGNLPEHVGGPALLDGAGAYALVLMIADDAAARLAQIREILEAAARGAYGGASAFEGKLVCRILAPDGSSLRRLLLPIMAILRGESAPRLWMV